MNTKLEVTTTTKKEITCTLDESQVAEILSDWARKNLAPELGSDAEAAQIGVDFHGVYADHSFDRATITLTTREEFSSDRAIESNL